MFLYYLEASGKLKKYRNYQAFFIFIFWNLKSLIFFLVKPEMGRNTLVLVLKHNLHLMEYLVITPILLYEIRIRVSSRIFCLGGKNSLTTPTFVGTLYWHVINLFCTTLGH